MKRLLVLGLIAVLVLAACNTTNPPAEQGTPAGEAPLDLEQSATPTAQAVATALPRPVIRMQANGDEVTGLPGAYCWLQAANDIRCEPDPLSMEPQDTVTVAPGEELTFSVAGDAGQPAALSARLLDDVDETDEAVEMDFGAVASAAYTVDLDPGVHRFYVTAEYPDASADNTFVSTIFAIEVPEGIAQAATEPSDEAEATDEAAMSATDEATEEATEEMAGDATEESAMSATEEEKATATSDKTETEATEEVATANAATEMPAATSQAGPTTAPTDRPTATDRPAPSATPQPAPTDRPTASATPADESGSGMETAAVPEVVVVNGGERYAPSAMELCTVQAGTEICEDVPAETASERILLGVGDTVRIDLAEAPSSISLALFDNSLTQEQNRLNLAGGSRVALYTASASPGNYILGVTTTYETTITYFFRVQIME